MPGSLNSPYRFDPFDQSNEWGGLQPEWNGNDEFHTAAMQQNGRVGFFTFEAPQLRVPSETVLFRVEDSTTMAEVARLTAPGPDQYRVDYDADGFFGTGFVEVHASQAGKQFRIGYYGLGTPPRWETIRDGSILVGEDLAVEGDLEVVRDFKVLDEYDSEIFSVQDGVISTHGNKIEDVGDAVDGADAVNLQTLRRFTQYLFGWTFAGVPADCAGVCEGVAGGVASGQFTLIAVFSLSTGSKAIARSTNGGASWSAVSVPENSNAWKSIAFGDGVFVAVASSGSNRVMRSTDGGASWSAVSIDGSGWESVTFGDGAFVAVASSGTNRAARSTNGGASWSAVSVPENSNAWKSIAFGDGVFVAVASSGSNRVMRSTDGGASWSAVSIDAREWRFITFGNSLFVAVADAGAGGDKVARSDDGGQTWEYVTLAPRMNNVTFVNGFFLIGGELQPGSAAATRCVLQSFDGVTWRHTAMPGGFYRVGGGGEIAVVIQGLTATLFAVSAGL